MKVRIDVIFGEENQLDVSFLEKRDFWLTGVGLYLEFIIKGVYTLPVDFKVESDGESVVVSRYSWNRFFLNLKKSGDVVFSILLDGVVVIEKNVTFNVVNVRVPLVISVPSLLSNSISDIRYFANKLSKNLINSTRFVLFTTNFLEGLNLDLSLSDEFFRFYDMIFAILTERGLSLIVSPFGDSLYSMDFIKEKGKDILFSFIERGRKYNIVWDFTTGLGYRELLGLLDSVQNRFKDNIHYAVDYKMLNRVGGEGLCYVIIDVKYEDDVHFNYKGKKIARIINPVSNYGLIRDFTKKVVEQNWGVELSYSFLPGNLKEFNFQFCRAVYEGYSEVSQAVEDGC